MSETPVSLATAKSGDKVIKRVGRGTYVRKTLHFSLATVTSATPKYITTTMTKFHRGTGRPTVSTNVWLVDPTPDNLALLRKSREEDRAESEKKEAEAAAYNKERERQALAAAGWLARTKDPAVVRACLYQQILIDAYDELTRKGVLEEKFDADRDRPGEAGQDAG